VRIHHKASCAHCHAAHPAEPLRAPRDASLGWACVECAFKCRACGFVVPLDRLETTGAVECAHCGLEQAFDVRAWHEALDHAHEVADGMVAGVGTDRVSSQETIRTENSFQITTSPGRPLCKTCHGLLDVSVADAHRATATCAACKTSEVYEVPAATVRLTDKTLSAILATEHRADRKAARVEKSAGAIAVTCPSCSAPLEVSEGTTFAQCKYCQVTCRIPASVWARMGGKPPRPESMWLAFDGPSRTRHEAQQRKAEHAHQALVQQLREKKRAAEGRDDEMTAREALAQRLREAKEEARRPAPRGAAWQEDPVLAVPVPPTPAVAPTPAVVPTPATFAGPPATSPPKPPRAGGRGTLVAVVLIVAVLAVAAVVVAVTLGAGQ